MKKQAKSIAEIEAMLNKKPLLRFNVNAIQQLPSKEYFITRGIFEYNDEYHTYSVKGNRQSDMDTWRSVGDMYRITKYYYPDTTLLEYLKIFYKDFFGKSFKTLNDQSNLPYRGQFCPDVNKKVFKKNWSGGGRWLYDILKKDEFGRTIPEWLAEIADNK